MSAPRVASAELSTGSRLRRPRARLRSVAALLSVLVTSGLVLAACGSDADSSSPSTAATAEAVRITGEVTVSAAASLEESVTRIAEDFEAANPGAKITVNFGSSGDLATQIRSGAPVDVAAFAAESDMRSLADASLLDGEPQVFATNSLVIVTRPGNPTGIESLSGLATAAGAGGTVSMCADAAPCGRYADQILRRAGVSIPADRVTRGQDVRATLSAVTEGDADAAIVYVTDAKAAGGSVAPVDIPADQNAVARYPIAVVKATKHRKASEAFVAYVLSATAQRILARAGFGAP